MSAERSFGALRGSAPWFLSVFLIGLALGFAADRIYFQNTDGEEDSLVEIRSTGYRYIRPLLECEVLYGKGRGRELATFRSEIKRKADELEDGGKVKLLSVYFRDLNNGPAFSINPQEEFVPASLLKVPTMISALQMAESNPGFLETPITLPWDFPIDRGQSFPQREFMKPGATYTIEDLIQRMIVHSDNSATLALNMILPKGADLKVLSDLGVGLHEKDGRGDWMPVSAYASFFRVLFNSSYIGREMSEKALTILSKTELPPGLRPLAPAGVEMAQKFGHFRLPGVDGSEQLHLCGIVYYPDHPYLLCVMTRGNDLAAQADAIGSVGEAIFKEVDQRAAALETMLVN